MTDSAVNTNQRLREGLQKGLPVRGESRLYRFRIVIGLVAPVLLIVVWEIAAHRPDAPNYLVGPIAIVSAFFRLLVSGNLSIDALASTARAYSGFCLGAIAGISLGLLSGVSRRVNAFFDPLVSMLYPVPKVALLPVLITWLGFGDASKVALITLAVFFPTFINALYGARAISPRLFWAARNMGAGRLRIFFKVVFPASLPSIFNGLRTGLALAFIVLFATEMVGSKNGLGNMIVGAEENLRYDWMYAGIFAIALIGFASDRVLMFARTRILAGKFAGEGRDE